jgi:ubiquinone/menaquinone biosynthesis C-methylase UbiE
MSSWTKGEIERLSAIVLERIYEDLKPLNSKKILVLCSGEGDVAFWLAGKEEDFRGEIVGLELNDELLERSLKRAGKLALKGIVEFRKAEKHRIPLPDGEFDALVSEFIVFPTPTPTEIGQEEMARVLRSGGKMILTDVIATRRLPEHVRSELELVGLSYLCYATLDDFKRWMSAAGLKNVEVLDLTPLVRQVWEERSRRDPSHEHREGYHLLLSSEYQLGETIFYIYAKGEKV